LLSLLAREKWQGPCAYKISGATPMNDARPPENSETARRPDGERDKPAAGSFWSASFDEGPMARDGLAIGDEVDGCWPV
jgi:hypothetical protein